MFGQKYQLNWIRIRIRIQQISPDLGSYTDCVSPRIPLVDAGLMCPRPMCSRPKILGCCAPWTKRPLDIVSLTDVSRPWTASSMELAPSAAIAASVGLRRLMNHWGVWPASPSPLTGFIGLAPLRRMHARPTHRTPPLRSAKAHGSWKSGVASLNQIKGMGWFGQGQNSQGTLCPRVATSKNFRSGTHRSGMD